MADSALPPSPTLLSPFQLSTRPLEYSYMHLSSVTFLSLFLPHGQTPAIGGETVPPVRTVELVSM